jgi:chorismate dehydratase
MTLRIGSVPYLNVKPLVDWFHEAECDADVKVTYAVPSQLARMLREDLLDVANVSTFECLRAPGLDLVPDISISADGAVKSVRLFCKRPPAEIRSVALDTSSLTSAALCRILLAERFRLSPRYEHHPPNLDAMLQDCDAALLIGDLKLFNLMPGTTVYDLGAGWKDLTGLPFVYAAWLAREDRVSSDMISLLARAKEWGIGNLDLLSERWSERMRLPLDRCRNYLIDVMDYGLGPAQMEGLHAFQQKCRAHGLIDDLTPIRLTETPPCPIPGS